jgi:hypothetical protein
MRSAGSSVRIWRFQFEVIAMRTALVIALAGFGLAASVAPLAAHHSLSGTYDVTKVQTIRGTVTSLSFRNPHVRIYLDVPDADGRIVNWIVETWGTGQLSVRGLTNDFLKPGDRVSADVFVAKDGTARGSVHALTLPDGRTIDGPPSDFSK